MSETKFTIQDDQKTLVIERTFQAPKSKVWAAWTKPEIFAKWWGPRGWQTTITEADFSEGGTMVYGMKCEDPEQKDWYGQTSWGKMTFHNIDAENSFAYDDAFCDENGTVTPGMPVVTIGMQFIEDGGATRIISTGTYDTPEALQQVIAMGMKEGLAQTWDRLEELLA